MEWPAAGWTLELLEARFPALPLSTVALDGGRVAMDDRVGLLVAKEPLGPFVRSVREGRAQRYAMAWLSELSEELTREVPKPAYIDRAGWTMAVLWIGAAGTVSGMHHDLADNLHTQLAGRKRFWLVDPADSKKLRPNGLFHGVPNGCSVDLEAPGASRDRSLDGLVVHTAELQQGDALYLPRGWWHHVRTLESGVSVNHWWADGWRRVVVEGADLFKRLRGVSR